MQLPGSDSTVLRPALVSPSAPIDPFEIVTKSEIAELTARLELNTTMEVIPRSEGLQRLLVNVNGRHRPVDLPEGWTWVGIRERGIREAHAAEAARELIKVAHDQAREPSSTSPASPAVLDQLFPER
jgi:hypothetical protein